MGADIFSGMVIAYKTFNKRHSIKGIRFFDEHPCQSKAHPNPVHLAKFRRHLAQCCLISSEQHSSGVVRD